MWNCRGAGKKQFVRKFKDLSVETQPYIAIVVEPRVSGQKANRIIRQLKFSNSYRVEARGFAGGIWLLWDEEVVQIQVLHCHTQFIHVQITKDGVFFMLTAIYASPQNKWRRYLWRNLASLAEQITVPWLLAGDFNAVLSGDERKDRSGRPGVADNEFQNCVNQSRLMDLGAIGSKFTWKGGGRHARLDRFLCNDLWRLAFQNAIVFHLPLACSDHRPILIKDGVAAPPRAHRPFRCNLSWKVCGGNDALFWLDKWLWRDASLADALPYLPEDAAIPKDWNEISTKFNEEESFKYPMISRA
ncbi:hypothetical protein Tsubulata_050912 [Turnera subulata]|uniref:Endonuclease/exonuclease/phosphatase domain-containing protein n=1 Tax=Turnera subulata TaxID=218843 RepID=A0A9Q0J1Y7_9ROSI|nr:hypothetical protein Tsubulata_050912 [Turnera subulata]